MDKIISRSIVEIKNGYLIFGEMFKENKDLLPSELLSAKIGLGLASIIYITIIYLIIINLILAYNYYSKELYNKK